MKCPWTLPVLLLFVGCSSQHARYPDEWSPATAPAVAAADSPGVSTNCPRLAGRYSNGGVLAPGTPQELCKSAMHIEYRMIGDWFCETSLSLNIGAVDAGGWVELRQPDPDTLIVIAGDGTVDPVELHRSRGDFDCRDGQLVRTLRAPTTSLGYDEGQENTATRVYNVFSAVTNAFLATGGVQTLKRSFSVAADGTLVMRVERTTHALLFALPINYDHSTYVSWTRDTSAAVAAGEPAPAPSAQVARLHHYRKHAFAAIWLTTVDGAELDDRELVARLGQDTRGAEFWDVPQLVEPGLHWIEWRPWTRIGVRYGAVVDLQAGHVYRLAEAPPDCGSADTRAAHQANRSLYWRQLQIEDAVAGSPPRVLQVRALCGAYSKGCRQDTDCDAVSCFRAAESDWGLCGQAPDD